MGMDVLYDLFGLSGQTILFDQGPCSLFRGGVAAQKFHAARLQALNTEILVRGVLAVGVLGCVMQWRPGFAWIKNIAHGGLSRLRVVNFDPLPDSVLLPDVVTVIQHVGGPIQRAHDLDLISGDAASELESRERVFSVLQKSRVVDGKSVHRQLYAPRRMRERVELRSLPIRFLPHVLSMYRFAPHRRGSRRDRSAQKGPA